jgi:hypothetical protein
MRFGEYGRIETSLKKTKRSLKKSKNKKNKPNKSIISLKRTNF